MNPEYAEFLRNEAEDWRREQELDRRDEYPAAMPLSAEQLAREAEDQRGFDQMAEDFNQPPVIQVTCGACGTRQAAYDEPGTRCSECLSNRLVAS